MYVHQNNGSVLTDTIVDSADSVMELPDSALQLVVEGFTQRVKEIRVRVLKENSQSPSMNPLWTSYAFTYEGKLVHSPDEPADCRKIMTIFPPTTLGQFDSRDLSYSVLFNNGISFRFQIKDKATFENLKARRDHPVLVDGYSPIMSEIRIMTRELSDTERLSSLPRFEVYPNEGVSLKLPFEDSSIVLRLGVGPQDIMSALGFPDDQWNGIFNYFQYGLDVVTCPEKMNIVISLILHSNPPGHIQFGRYSRSWFVLSQGKKKSKEILNNTCTIPEFAAAFGDPGQPLVVSNTSPKNIQYFYTFPNGLCIETTPDGVIASVHISLLNI